MLSKSYHLPTSLNLLVSPINDASPGRHGRAAIGHRKQLLIAAGAAIISGYLKSPIGRSDTDYYQLSRSKIRVLIRSLLRL